MLVWHHKQQCQDKIFLHLLLPVRKTALQYSVLVKSNTKEGVVEKLWSGSMVVCNKLVIRLYVYILKTVKLPT